MKTALARSDYWLSYSSDYLTAKSPLCQQLIMKRFRCLFGALQAAYGEYFFCSCSLKSRFNRAGRKNKVVEAVCRQKKADK